jgi:hypothetical protein
VVDRDLSSDVILARRTGRLVLELSFASLQEHHLSSLQEHHSSFLRMYSTIAAAGWKKVSCPFMATYLDNES